jgi:ferritin-like metal-binding protein YciE
MKTQKQSKSIREKANRKSKAPTSTKKSTAIDRFVKQEPSTDGIVKNEGFVETLQHIFSTSSKQRTLQDLFKAALQDLLNAEKQLAISLPKMAKAVETPGLKKIFLKHHDQTKRQIQRLEKLMDRLKIGGSDKKCKAMQGLIEEEEEFLKNFPPGLVRDSALVMAAQKVEHYEISTYYSLCELADVLGLNSVYDDLFIHLEEEQDMDKKLTEISRDINEEASEA